MLKSIGVSILFVMTTILPAQAEWIPLEDAAPVYPRMFESYPTDAHCAIRMAEAIRLMDEFIQDQARLATYDGCNLCARDPRGAWNCTALHCEAVNEADRLRRDIEDAELVPAREARKAAAFGQWARVKKECLK